MALTLCVLNIHYLWTRAADHYRCICAIRYQYAFQSQRLAVHNELATKTSTAFQHRPMTIPPVTQPPLSRMVRAISFQISNRVSLFLYIIGLCSLSIQSVANCHISWYVILAHFVREKMSESVTLWIVMIWIECLVLMWFDCWSLSNAFLSVSISLSFSLSLIFSLSLFVSA